MADTSLLIVQQGHATFGLIVRDGVVIEAPPIARWTTGKPEAQVAAYYLRKGAILVVGIS